MKIKTSPNIGHINPTTLHLWYPLLKTQVKNSCQLPFSAKFLKQWVIYSQNIGHMPSPACSILQL